MTDRRTWTLSWPDLDVYSSNEEMRDHHMVRHRKMRPIKTAGATAAWLEGVPPLGCAEVEFITIRRHPMDADGPHPTYKALLDGVVSAGVLPDDGPEFLRAVTYHAVELGAPEVRMLIREVER